MIETKKFVRKPLYVDAVRVTADNFEEVSAWCQGEILLNEGQTGNRSRYIKVRVHNPKIPRQAQAFVGDWLLYTDRGYKVYTNKAFQQTFNDSASLVEKKEKAYPYEDPEGEIIVLGPECFIKNDGSVLSWKGANYVPQVAAGEKDLVSAEEARKALELPRLAEPTLPIDDSPAHAAAVEQIKEREGVITPPTPIEQVPSEGRVIDKANPHSIGLMAEDPDPKTGVGPIISVTEPVTTDQLEESPPSIEEEIHRELHAPVDHESLAMKQARETIEAEGGEVVPATPEAIANAVAENVEPVVDAGDGVKLADGPSAPPVDPENRRVLSLQEQERMSKEEIRALLETGEVILVQDIAA